MRSIAFPRGLTVLLLAIITVPAAATPPPNTLHSFTGPDGASPLSGLIQGSDGLLYGTNASDGSNGDGNVFKIAPGGSSFGEVFSFNGTDGSFVSGGVVQASDGNLYGMTQGGGANGDGTIYKVTTGGTGYTDLHDFGSSATDGQAPVGSLIQGSDGDLYGTTFGGGALGFGTVFKIAPTGGPVTYLHSFGASDLQIPQCTLVECPDGSLYGTADAGGAGVGGVFRINLDGTGYTVLHVFAGGPADGANCFCGLTVGGDGFLYGVTAGGGASGNGAVFKIKPDGSGYQLLRSFAGGSTDGSFPQGGLALGNDSMLYGATIHGGPTNDGSVFNVSRDGTVYNVLHLFAGSDGSEPSGGLLQGTDGGIYGITSTGTGVDSLGTVFSLLGGLSPSPTGVYALGSDAQVQIFWTADTLATTYNLYRSTTTAGEGVVPYQTGLVTPHFFDNNVSNGTQYFYEVTAVNGGFEGVRSYEVTASALMALKANGLSASPNPVTASKSTTGTVTLVQATTGPTPVFLSSSDPSVTFTNPNVTVPTGQPSTTFTINTANTGAAVTANITASENGTDSTTALTVNVPSILHTFQPGLQMVAAPTDDTGDSLSNIFAQSNPKLAVWTGAAYAISPTSPADTFKPGQGYWFHPGSASSLYDIGADTSSVQPTSVSLVAGWNMIGDPFNVAAAVSGLQVMSGANTVSFANANLDGLVGATFYTWQPGDAAYEVLPASTTTLQPFEGYWLFAFAPCTLIFPAGG